MPSRPSESSTPSSSKAATDRYRRRGPFLVARSSNSRTTDRDRPNRIQTPASEQRLVTPSSTATTPATTTSGPGTAAGLRAGRTSVTNSAASVNAHAWQSFGQHMAEWYEPGHPLHQYFTEATDENSLTVLRTVPGGLEHYAVPTDDERAQDAAVRAAVSRMIMGSEGIFPSTSRNSNRAFAERFKYLVISSTLLSQSSSSTSVVAGTGLSNSSELPRVPLDWPADILEDLERDIGHLLRSPGRPDPRSRRAGGTTTTGRRARSISSSAELDGPDDGLRLDDHADEEPARLSAASKYPTAPTLRHRRRQLSKSSSSSHSTHRHAPSLPNPASITEKGSSDPSLSIQRSRSRSRSRLFLFGSATKSNGDDDDDGDGRRSTTTALWAPVRDLLSTRVPTSQIPHPRALLLWLVLFVIAGLANKRSATVIGVTGWLLRALYVVGLGGNGHGHRVAGGSRRRERIGPAPSSSSSTSARGHSDLHSTRKASLSDSHSRAPAPAVKDRLPEALEALEALIQASDAWDLLFGQALSAIDVALVLDSPAHVVSLGASKSLQEEAAGSEKSSGEKLIQAVERTLHTTFTRCESVRALFAPLVEGGEVQRMLDEMYAPQLPSTPSLASNGAAVDQQQQQQSPGLSPDVSPMRRGHLRADESSLSISFSRSAASRNRSLMMAQSPTFTPLRGSRLGGGGHSRVTSSASAPPSKFDHQYTSSLTDLNVGSGLGRSLSSASASSSSPAAAARRLAHHDRALSSSSGTGANPSLLLGNVGRTLRRQTSRSLSPLLSSEGPRTSALNSPPTAWNGAMTTTATPPSVKRSTWDGAEDREVTPRAVGRESHIRRIGASPGGSSTTLTTSATVIAIDKSSSSPSQAIDASPEELIANLPNTVVRRAIPGRQRFGPSASSTAQQQQAQQPSQKYLPTPSNTTSFLSMESDLDSSSVGLPSATEDRFVGSSSERHQPLSTIASGDFSSDDLGDLAGLEASGQAEDEAPSPSPAAAYPGFEPNIRTGSVLEREAEAMMATTTSSSETEDRLAVTGDVVGIGGETSDDADADAAVSSELLGLVRRIAEPYSGQEVSFGAAALGALRRRTSQKRASIADSGLLTSPPRACARRRSSQGSLSLSARGRAVFGGDAASDDSRTSPSIAGLQDSSPSNARSNHLQQSPHSPSHVTSNMNALLAQALASRRHTASSLLALRFSGEDETSGYWEDVRDVVRCFARALVEGARDFREAIKSWEDGERKAQQESELAVAPIGVVSEVPRETLPPAETQESALSKQKVPKKSKRERVVSAELLEALFPGAASNEDSFVEEDESSKDRPSGRGARFDATITPPLSIEETLLAPSQTASENKRLLRPSPSQELASFAPMPSDLARFASHMDAMAFALQEAQSELRGCLDALQSPPATPGHLDRTVHNSEQITLLTDQVMVRYGNLRKSLGNALRECERGRGPLAAALNIEAAKEAEGEDSRALTVKGPPSPINVVLAQQETRSHLPSPTLSPSRPVLEAPIDPTSATSELDTNAPERVPLDKFDAFLTAQVEAQSRAHLSATTPGLSKTNPLGLGEGVELNPFARPDPEVVWEAVVHPAAPRERSKMSRAERIRQSKERRDNRGPKSGAQLSDFGGDTTSGDERFGSLGAQEWKENWSKWGPSGDVVSELRSVIDAVGEKRRPTSSSASAAEPAGPVTESDLSSSTPQSLFSTPQQSKAPSPSPSPAPRPSAVVPSMRPRMLETVVEDYLSSQPAESRPISLVSLLTSSSDKSGSRPTSISSSSPLAANPLMSSPKRAPLSMPLVPVPPARPGKNKRSALASPPESFAESGPDFRPVSPTQVSLRDSNTPSPVSDAVVQPPMAAGATPPPSFGTRAGQRLLATQPDAISKTRSPFGAQPPASALLNLPTRIGGTSLMVDKPLPPTVATSVPPVSFRSSLTSPGNSSLSPNTSTRPAHSLQRSSTASSSSSSLRSLNRKPLNTLPEGQELLGLGSETEMDPFAAHAFDSPGILRGSYGESPPDPRVLGANTRSVEEYFTIPLAPSQGSFLDYGDASSRPVFPSARMSANPSVPPPLRVSWSDRPPEGQQPRSRSKSLTGRGRKS